MLYTVEGLFLIYIPHICIYTCVTRAHTRNLRILEILTLELITWYIKVI